MRTGKECSLRNLRPESSFVVRMSSNTGRPLGGPETVRPFFVCVFVLFFVGWHVPLIDLSYRFIRISCMLVLQKKVFDVSWKAAIGYKTLLFS